MISLQLEGNRLQRPVVVQLTVVAECQPVHRHRLVPTDAQVEDREPSVGQLDGDLVALVVEEPLVVRSAMGDALDHASEGFAVDLLITTGNPAHG
jgi:hypothetical protein